jgi:cytolysin-activating lysine-acyltransferase
MPKVESRSDRLAPNGELDRVRFGSPLRESDAVRVKSGVLFLSQHSRLHAQYPVAMLDRRIDPSLPLGQFHYYTDREGTPAAFCNWVWLTVPVLEEVMASGRDLEPHEFNCGEQPFFYEFLAPFGHCRAVVRGLRELPFFRGRRIPAIRGETDDWVPRVRYFQF